MPDYIHHPLRPSPKPTPIPIYRPVLSKSKLFDPLYKRCCGHVRLNYGSMMVDIVKPAFCILAGICLLAQAAQPHNQVADKTYLTKQKNIYELFWHVDQPTVYHPELYQKARTFNIAENVENYSDQKAVTEFIELLKHGMLPRGHVFTLLNLPVYHQTMVLFRVLYSAKNFEVFYNTAVWARFHVNEYMYTYALSVAVLQRPDTKYMKIPPLYEVLPHFFFNEDVMQKAYNIAMGDVAGVKKSVTGGDSYVIPANYSGWYLTKDDVVDQKLTYFTEDVGLNYFYFLINHQFPPFMNSTSNVLEQVRGEYYFFLHKQLLNRYNLERLSNDMGEISYVSLDRPVPTGYYPTMHFRNGLPFPHRETGAVVPLSMHHYVQKSAAFIDMIFPYTDQSKMASNKGFRQVYRYKETLPKYTQEQLSFPGVKVETVTVDKLTTYFDYFETMLSNGVSVRSHKEAKNTMIKARQYRLNHKPFTYHINVHSDTNTKAVVRIFLGPKYDVYGHELDLEQNILKSGSNTIERGSHQSLFLVPDEVSSDVLYKKMEAGLDGSESFTYTTQPYGFPDRLILPKGKKGGMTFKLFVVVSPFDETKSVTVESPIWGPLTLDGRNMGFPLDRPVDHLHFVQPNMHFKDVVVYHKEMEELNVVV